MRKLTDWQSNCHGFHKSSRFFFKRSQITLGRNEMKDSRLTSTSRIQIQCEHEKKPSGKRTKVAIFSLLWYHNSST